MDIHTHILCHAYSVVCVFEYLRFFQPNTKMHFKLITVKHIPHIAFIHINSEIYKGK